MPRPVETFRVKPTLPGELAILKELAHNLAWSWTHDTIELFRHLDPDLWNQSNHNPVKMLGLVKQEKLVLAARDDGFMAQLRRAYHELHDYLSAQTWYSAKYEPMTTPKIAYFSMEFGLTECLPIYSGGLGILAGDHLKSASELGLPLAGVGLLYQQGYFRQYLNADGWQQETFPDNDFYNLPITLEVDATGKPLQVEVAFPERSVFCRIWKAEVGRIPLYLLDTNTPENQPRDRKITYQLYGGDEETRIQQELILGIGGMKALHRLDIHPHVCHMNEGHAAFMALERIRHRMEKDHLSFDEGLEVVRAGTIFTTHTPVPAGIDIFEPAMVDKYFQRFYQEIGVPREEFIGLGRWNPRNPHEPFNMALLALRTTSFANGVSRLHGDVSRKMWQAVWPQVPLQEVPIDSVTNGIHTRSWISAEMSALLLRYLGPNWLRKPADQSVWKGVERIPDVELWRIHERRRERLVAFTRERLGMQLQRRGAAAREIEYAHEALSPEVLTIGFARRFATYKRAGLLLRDVARLKRLLNDPDRPVQFVFAGKAHPRDNQGKELIKQLVHFSREEGVRKRVVFLEDYDMSVARYLVQGVDIWLNTPQRPLEASGTSGMKVIPNGGLNLSVLDGWWVEGYETDTGWAIGAGEEYEDAAYRDEVESKSLFDVIENDIIPLFYDLGNDGLPRKWIHMVKSSMMKLGPVFNTNRMVQEYTDRFYMKAYHGWRGLSADGFARAREVVRWKKGVRNHWGEVEIVRGRLEKAEVQAGTALRVEAEVYLGALRQDDVMVQVYAGPLDSDYSITEGTVRNMRFVDSPQEGVYRYSGFIPCDESGLFGYLIRVMPYHPDLNGSFGLELMRWIGEGNRVPATQQA
jgi:glycogen phosphorylase